MGLGETIGKMFDVGVNKGMDVLRKGAERSKQIAVDTGTAVWQNTYVRINRENNVFALESQLMDAYRDMKSINMKKSGEGSVRFHSLLGQLGITEDVFNARIKPKYQK